MVWSNIDMSAIFKLIEVAVRIRFLSIDDELIVGGTFGQEAYHMAAGRLVYTQKPGESNVEHLTTTIVQPGSWLCEAALWSYWLHVGTLQAERRCRLLAIDAEKLIVVL